MREKKIENEVEKKLGDFSTKMNEVEYLKLEIQNRDNEIQSFKKIVSNYEEIDCLREDGFMEF